MTILKHPRIPNYDGVESVKWSEVNKDFHHFLAAYYARNNIKAPSIQPISFSECDKKIRRWMSEHSILGDPESDTFHNGVLLPVVNPNTGKLNAGAVRSANAYASKIKDIDKQTLEETKTLLKTLYADQLRIEDISIEDYAAIMASIII